MRIFDTLIIGCGYFSAGFAVSKKNSIICEENQICDNSFYLPLKSYKYSDYSPSTKEGKKLMDIFNSLGLIKEKEQNINGFECGFCKYLTQAKTEILLKCRVVDIKEENGIFKIKIHSNEGLSHIYAKSVLNTVNKSSDKSFTVLFTTDCIDIVKPILTEVFSGSYVEPAFYQDRYALHLKADCFDQNSIKTFVYEKWNTLEISAKIIYMAPDFATKYDGTTLCDEKYSNPIEAFEAGYREGEK